MIYYTITEVIFQPIKCENEVFSCVSRCEHKTYYIIYSQLRQKVMVATVYNNLITCKSITAATQLEQLLLKNGCLCTVVQPPKNITGSSCAYGVKLNSSCLNHARKLIHDHSIPIGKIFFVSNGQYKEI